MSASAALAAMAAEGEEMQGEEEAMDEEAKLVAKRPAAKLVAKRPAAKLVAKRPAAKLVAKRPAANDDDDKDDKDDDQDADETSCLRDRLKMRKFEALWDELPEEVVQAFDYLKKDRSGNSRAKTTQLVNSIIKRDPKTNALSLDLKHPTVTKMTSFVKKKFKTDVATGVIYEEAAARCGGEDKLAQAVNRQAVLKSKNASGVELFFFPSMAIGSSEETNQSTKGQKTKGISNESFGQWEDFINDMGWRINISQDQLTDFQEANPKQGMPPQEMEKLDKVSIDFSSAIKGIDRQLAKAPLDPSATLMAAMETSHDLRKQGQNFQADVSYLIKFRKQRDGKQIGLDAIQKVIQDGAPLLRQIIDNFAVVKALMPKSEAKA